MKTLTSKQLILRYAMAFALGTISTLGVLSAGAFFTHLVMQMHLDPKAALIGEMLIQEQKEKNPSFEKALQKATTAEPIGDSNPQDTSIWHPIGELTVCKKSDAPGMPLAYCETQVAGKHLVIYSAGVEEWDSNGSSKWVTSHELHALLDRRNTTTTPAKPDAESQEKPPRR